MPKAIKKRMQKTEQQETDLRETVEDIRERLKERQRTLVYALLAVGVIAILAAGFYIYNASSTSKAQGLRYEGYKLLYGRTQTPMAPAERYKSALEKFKQSYAAKKNPVTLLYIADSHYALGAYDEAIKTLNELTARYSDPAVTSLANYRLAMTYLKKGDANSALAALNNLTAPKDGPLQDMALLESGKLLETMGKTAEAKAKYNELLKKFPQSALLGEAKARLAKLGG